MLSAPNYENIIIDVVGTKKNVGLIQLNRPKALNALCKPLFVEIGKAVKDFDSNDSIAAIIITGKVTLWHCTEMEVHSESSTVTIMESADELFGIIPAY